jgi:predicted MPP superfamily phosphohydrolase
MKITNYRVSCPKLSKTVKIALASDLHNNPFLSTLEGLTKAKPDMILIPGDLTDDIYIKKGAEQTLAFLRGCAEIAPTYYSLGNHEIRCYHKGNPWRKPIPEPISEAFRQDVGTTGAILLDNESVCVGDFLICGLTSGINGSKNEPNTAVLDAFCKENAEIKLLLCHHPEYYPTHLKDKKIDLIVCGHAHGGQWRIFNRGVYAPGQGLFPKYTSGVIGGNCVISRGLGDHTWIPRIFNPRELVIIEFGNV